jgi:hypothetical protein
VSQCFLIQHKVAQLSIFHGIPPGYSSRRTGGLHSGQVSPVVHLQVKNGDDAKPPATFRNSSAERLRSVS